MGRVAKEVFGHKAVLADLRKRIFWQRDICASRFVSSLGVKNFLQQPRSASMCLQLDVKCVAIRQAQEEEVEGA